MKYLILGADGYIGNYLYRRLKEDGRAVVGTSRHKTEYGEYSYFDILDGGIQRIIYSMGEGRKAAVLCISQSNIAQCVEQYHQSYMINVIKTKELVRLLCQHGFQVIFFSTDNVFDGKTGNYTEESPTNAINKYGMMKEEMERYLLGCGTGVGILRLSKVVGTEVGKKNILSEWERQGEAGELRCVRRNCLSFVAMEDVYQACVIVAERGMYGIYHIAGDRSFSRAELARNFYGFLGRDVQCVKEYEAEVFGFQDARPLNISMNNAKFREETGYEFTSMNAVIKQYLKNKQYFAECEKNKG